MAQLDVALEDNPTVLVGMGFASLSVQDMMLDFHGYQDQRIALLAEWLRCEVALGVMPVGELLRRVVEKADERFEVLARDPGPLEEQHPWDRVH